MSGKDTQDQSDHSIMEPVSGPEGHDTPQNIRADTETVAEGAGGFLTGVSGLAIGAAAGPIGAILGGLAGTVGGWWAGREIAHAITAEDDRYYRDQYEHAPDRLADLSYDQVRAAYVVGHLAGRNPEYKGRSFDDVESDLRSSWQRGNRDGYGDWMAMRGYARVAFDRARSVPSGI